MVIDTKRKIFHNFFLFSYLWEKNHQKQPQFRIDTKYSKHLFDDPHSNSSMRPFGPRNSWRRRPLASLVVCDDKRLASSWFLPGRAGADGVRNGRRHHQYRPVHVLSLSLSPSVQLIDAALLCRWWTEFNILWVFWGLDRCWFGGKLGGSRCTKLNFLINAKSMCFCLNFIQST